MKVLLSALVTLIYLPLAEAKTVTYHCVGQLIDNAINHGHVIESKTGTFVLGDEEKFFILKFDTKSVSCDVNETNDKLIVSLGDDPGNRYSETVLFGAQSGLLPRFSTNYSYGLDSKTSERLEVTFDCKQ